MGLNILSPFRLAVENHVEHGEAGVLRGAGATLEVAHGEIPRLPLPAEVGFEETGSSVPSLSSRFEFRFKFRFVIVVNQAKKTGKELKNSILF